MEGVRLMVKLAIRYWIGGARRFLVTGLLILVAVFLYCNAYDSVRAVEGLMNEPARRFLGGDIAIFRQGTTMTWERTSKGLSGRIHGSGPTVFKFEELPPLPGTWSKTLGLATFLVGDGNPIKVSVLGRSVEFAEAPLRPTVVEGRFLEPQDEGRFVTVLREGNQYRCEVGDILTLSVPTWLISDGSISYGEPNTVEFEVVGIYRDPLFNTPIVPLSTLQQASNLLDDLVWTATTVKNPASLAAQVQDLSRTLPDTLKIISAPDMLAMITSEAENTRQISSILGVLVVILSLAAVVVSVLHALQQRRRELALLMACGLSPWVLGLLITLETTLLAALASVLGVLGHVFWTQTTGQPYYILETALPLVLAITAISAILGSIPSLTLARISPMEVLRNE